MLRLVASAIPVFDEYRVSSKSALKKFKKWSDTKHNYKINQKYIITRIQIYIYRERESVPKIMESKGDESRTDLRKESMAAEKRKIELNLKAKEKERALKIWGVFEGMCGKMIKSEE